MRNPKSIWSSKWWTCKQIEGMQTWVVMSESVPYTRAFATFTCSTFILQTPIAQSPERKQKSAK